MPDRKFTDRCDKCGHRWNRDRSAPWHMARCPACGTHISDGLKCKRCGSYVPIGASLGDCPGCGLTWERSDTIAPLLEDADWAAIREAYQARAKAEPKEPT